MSNSLRRAAGIDQPAAGDKTDSVRQALVANKDKIQAALPRQFSADRFVQLAISTIRKTPALMKCSMPSLAGAVMDAARLGLEVGVLGQGYIVPYGDEAQFIPGWQGLVDLVGRAGRAEAWTGAVYEGDKFEWQYGDSPFVRHQPCGEDEPERLTHVYACGRINGTRHPIIEVWPIAKVWKHRDRYNKVGTRHYSFKHPEMYARKVVLLQVLKYLPKSPLLTAAVEASNYEDRGTRTSISAEYVVVPDGEEMPAEAEAEQTPVLAEPEAPTLESLLNRVSKATTDDEFDLISSEAKEHRNQNVYPAVAQAIAGRIKALGG